MQHPEALDLETLLDAGGILGVDISPDGRSVVFASTAGGGARLYVQSLEGGDPVQITPDSHTAAQPKWSPTGEWIAYLEEVDGDENTQLLIVTPSGADVRNLTRCPGKVHENHAWSRDGRRIAYVSNRDGHFDVYYSTVPDGEVHRVTNHDAVHHAPEFSPDGTLLAFASNRTTYLSNWDTFVVSLADGQVRKVTDHDGEADEMSYYTSQSPRWSPDGRRILVASDVPGFYGIMAIDVHTLAREWIVRLHWDVCNAQWSPDGRQVAYVVNEDGNHIIHVHDLATGRSWPVSPAAGSAAVFALRGWGGDLRWTPDGSSIVYSYSGPADPPGLWIVAAGGGAPRHLYAQALPGIDRARLAVPSIVRYTSADGVEIAALLSRPRGVAGVVPAIVMPHGGPADQSVNGWNPSTQCLVSQGYAVLEPNYRGSTGYGRTFQLRNRHDWGGGDLADVVAGADWLRTQGIADRVGIMGGSFGGYLTLCAITRHPDRWQAAVDLCGVADLVTFYESGREDMRTLVARQIGTPDEHAVLYHERSPIHFVDRISCPLLILQGANDPRVPLAQAEQIRDAMAASGKPYEYVVYPGEGHGFAQKGHILDAQRRVAAFFDRHLATPGGG